MSEFWQRNISTFFHRLDSDKKGFISKNDFELAAQSLCDAEKTDPVKREELKKCYFDEWLLYMGSTNTDEKGVLTEAVLIDSLKKQRNDPKLKAILQTSLRCLCEAMNTNEDGYLQREEFRRLFDNSGWPDASYREQVFEAIDTDHDGKLSFEDFIHAFVEFLVTEDEDSPYNLCWGPLI